MGTPPESGKSEGAVEETKRYSVFTTAEKWCIVSMVSFAAWFSTLSSFIYYPAIPALSSALGVSINDINLTVTTYMSIATIAPSLVGDAADILGRRTMCLITLSLYFVANLAIALTKSYSALLGLRVLQAFAISGVYFLTTVRFGNLCFRHILYRLWRYNRRRFSC